MEVTDVSLRINGNGDPRLLAFASVEFDRTFVVHEVRLIKTGDGAYSVIAEWDSMDALAAARPQMIATLDGFRDTLEDLGGGMGLTDPVSGPVLLALK